MAFQMGHEVDAEYQPSSLWIQFQKLRCIWKLFNLALVLQLHNSTNSISNSSSAHKAEVIILQTYKNIM